MDRLPHNSAEFEPVDSIIEEEKKRQEENQSVPDNGSRYDHAGRLMDGGLPEERGEGRFRPSQDLRSVYNYREFSVSSENKSLLEKISDGGRKIFDGLLKIPLVNEVAAKYGMGWEKFWLNRRNDQIKDLGSKAQSFDLQISLRNRQVAALKSKNETNFIRSMINGVRVQNQMDEIAKLEGEKDKLMAQIGATEASAKLYAQKRDGVADWLIDFYGEKITPLETKLQAAEEKLKKFDIDNEPEEKRFKEIEVEIVKLEDEKKGYVTELAASGMSQKKIDKEVAFFGEQINELRAQLRERNDLRQQRAGIEQKIAQAKEKLAKADKRKEFINAKNSKALIITPTAAAVLAEARSVEQSDGQPIGPENEVAGNGRVDNPEDVVENIVAGKFDIGKTIAGWNEFIAKGFDPNSGFRVDPKIDLSDLAKKMGIKENESVDSAGFKKIICEFYEKKYKGKALNEKISGLWDKFAKNNGSLVAAENGGEDDLQLEVGRDSAQEGGPQDRSPENSENQAYRAEDMINAWNNFTRENAGAKNHADLTLNLPDLIKENRDLGEMVSPKRFKEAVVGFFVTNSLGGEQYRKIAEQSLEDFSKNAAALIDAMPKATAPEKEDRGLDLAYDESGELDIETQKFGIVDLAHQWKDFVIARFKSREYVIETDKIMRADGVPPDGLVNIEEFKAIISGFYGKHFRIDRRFKPALDHAISDFLKDGQGHAS